MKFKPFSKQLLFQKAVQSGLYKFILYGGAIRGGKTFVLLATVLFICLYFPRARYAVVRESIPSIKLNVLPVFHRLCNPKWTRQMPSASNNWTWTCVNGSQIIFFAEQFDRDKDLERFKGLEVDGFAAEEITELQEVTLYKMIERCGTWLMDERQASRRAGKDVPPAIVMASCNPSQNWVKTEVYDKWRKGELPEMWHYINARVWDNPFVDEEWIEGLRQMLPPLTFDRFVDGDWDAVPNDNAWCYAYDEKRHVSADIELNPHKPIIVTFDFNVDPVTCSVWQSDSVFYLHCLDELEVAKNQTNGLESTRALVKKLKTKYPVESYQYVITGDSTGNNKSTNSRHSNYQIIAQELGLPINQSIFKVRSKNIPIDTSETLVNTLVHALPSFKIHHRCDKMRRDFRMAKGDEKGGLLKDRNYYKMDYFDGARYVIDAIFPELIHKFPDYLYAWKKYKKAA